MNKNIKETAALLLESMGLDHTTAIDMYYRQIITERRIPFQPTAGINPNDSIMAIIRAKGIPHKMVDVNEEGHIIADKTKDPELYDWAVNG